MRILLVRPRLIGDVIFTTPAIRAVRRRYPEAWIGYLVEPTAAPVVQGNPHLDEVIVAPRRGGWRQWTDDVALARRLRRLRLDLVVDLHGGPRASWLTWASGARRRLGYDVLGRSWMYTETVHRPRRLGDRHSVLSQWDLLTPLGIAPPDPTRDPTEMPVDPDAETTVSARLAEARVRADHTLIVIHVSAGNPFRRWPLESFVDLVCELAAADSDRRLVITAGPSDAAARRRVIKTARDRLATPDQVMDWDEVSLAELRAVLARASLYIGGDSGPLHVASTTPVPIVGIYGPTLAARSEPWRSPELIREAVDAGPLTCRPCDQRRCEPGDFRCLTGITPAAVYAAADRALARQRVLVTG